MRRAALALWLVLSSSGAASAQDGAAPIDYTLENGLRVILQPLPGRRFTALAISYAVGARDVPAGWTGLAHLGEHLMFSGTDELGELELYASSASSSSTRGSTPWARSSTTP